MRTKRTILCVDDNDTDLSLRRFLLRAHGYDVLSASKPEEALEIVGQQSGALRLMIVSFRLPAMDSVETIRQARLIVPRLPAIILKGSSELQIFYPYEAHADILICEEKAAEFLLDKVGHLTTRRHAPQKPPVVSSTIPVVQPALK